MYARNEKIIPVDICHEMKVSYLDFTMSVIVGRALPDVRDGLKPVHRRILYTMHELSLTHNRPYKKSARIVGDTMGKYHPHGDSAIYDALVRMAQDFNLRYPLVDGQGNFGSVDGDPAAAMRYTEARMSAIAGEMLADIDKNTVEMVGNFDDSEQEPAVLPSAIPNLLVNGSSGIAVAMATNIPPHNLGEIIDALVEVIDSPKLTIKRLLKHVKGPDFPGGGIIYGTGGIREAYETGRGKIQVRARAAFEKVKKAGREQIVVTEIPYQVNKSKLLEEIASLVRHKKIEGISDLRDESDKDGMRMVVELRRDAVPEVVLNQLYKHTQMQGTFGVIMLALVNNQPRVMSLEEMLCHYLDHRRQMVRRRTQYDLDRAEARAHVLEGLRIAVKNIDAVIKLIRAAKNVQQAQDGLMEKFKLTETQAKAILEMRLQRLTGLEREKIETEYKEVTKLINSLKKILSSEKAILDVVRKELLEVKEKYGDERRTEIVGETADFRIEDLIADEDMVITISHGGYIKRLPMSAYRRQRRGGRGVTGAELKEEDFVEDVFIASAHQHILFFTDRGRVYWQKVHEIPQAGRAAKGRAIVNLLKLSPGESVTAFLNVREFEEGKHIFMATEQGIVKKTALMAFSNPRKGGIIAVLLKKDDKLINARLTDGEDYILLATRDGQAIRFPETDVRSMGRSSRGVKGISLRKGDRVIGMTVAKPDTTVLVATENGYGKRTKAEQYRLQKRGGSGVINIKTSARNGRAVGMMTVSDTDEVVLITTGGKIIRSPVSGISVIGRNTQGVRLISLKKGDKVLSLIHI